MVLRTTKIWGTKGVMVHRRDECADGAVSTAWGKLRLPGGYLLNRGCSGMFSR